LLPASLFRTLCCSILFPTVFSTWFLHVSFPSRYIPNYFATCVCANGLLLI
jgi:hypothetical protein